MNSRCIGKQTDLPLLFQVAEKGSPNAACASSSVGLALSSACVPGCVSGRDKAGQKR